MSCKKAIVDVYPYPTIHMEEECQAKPIRLMLVLDTRSWPQAFSVQPKHTTQLHAVNFVKIKVRLDVNLKEMNVLLMKRPLVQRLLMLLRLGIQNIRILSSVLPKMQTQAQHHAAQKPAMLWVVVLRR